MNAGLGEESFIVDVTQAIFLSLVTGIQVGNTLHLVLPVGLLGEI
tara:strand:- start:281 stop:415 length:135 start_codon:yes stop_codon:yes gene_type:complete